MASQTLPQLPDHNFPQPPAKPDSRQYDGMLIEGLVRIVERAEKKAPRPELGSCDWQSPESYFGACDSRVCRQKATIHHIPSEQEFCLAHFREVSRG